MNKNKIVESMDFNPSMKQNLRNRSQKTPTKNPVISSIARTMDEFRNEVPIHIDPSIVDPSIAQDRFEPDEDTIASLQILIESIRETGQNQPALVRPHPEHNGRYQLAYGHRRLEAIKTIANESNDPERWKFIAFVKNLTDEELLLLQTSENSERQNLTWIETAMWALKLTESCSIPQKKLALRIGTNESEISRMLSVARSVPHDIILAIGRAPSVGQPRWAKFAKLVSNSKTAESIRNKISAKEFKTLNPIDKFNASLKYAMDIQISTDSAAAQKITTKQRTTKSTQKIRFEGREICEVDAIRSGTQILIPTTESSFANWLHDNLPKLYSEFVQNAD